MSDVENLNKLDTVLHNTLNKLDSQEIPSMEQITQAITICKISKQILDIHKVRNQKEAIKLAYLTPSQKRQIGQGMIPVIDSNNDGTNDDQQES